MVSKFQILGFPDDLGVQNVGGRTGARLGPESFRKVWAKLNGKIQLTPRCSQDLDVPMGPDIEANHAQASQFTQTAAKNAERLIAIGGGHDYAAPWIHGFSMAYRESRKTIGCLNIDAHFDLRSDQPKLTSGSPFFRAIDRGWIRPEHLVEFGIQDHCNAGPLWDYAKQKKIRTVPMHELRSGVAVKKFKSELAMLRKKVDIVLLSLDLDALAMAFAPGVSSPQTEGLTGSEIIEIAEIAGADTKVASLGIFELAPPIDHGDQTVRLAAQVTWHFLAAGFSGLGNRGLATSRTRKK